MYAIKKHGKYLCRFLFRKGFDYRLKCNVSCFSEIITGSIAELAPIAREYDGKLVKIARWW